MAAGNFVGLNFVHVNCHLLNLFTMISSGENNVSQPILLNSHAPLLKNI
jgi:hypothetical protein